MKVLFVNNCLTGGGSEKAMTIIANYFVSQGIETVMIVLNERPRTYYVDERIKIIECYCPIEGNKLLWHFKRILTIRKELKKEGSKIIITFLWDINMNVILASFGLRKYIIASERCDPHNETRKLMKFAMWFVLPFADHTVFQTEIVRSYYPRHIQRKSSVIPNAVSDTVPYPDRSIIDKEIVAVGRLTAQKNFKMLIDAFEIFYKHHPEYILTIYGEGVLRNELEYYVKEKGLEESIRLPGYIYDLDNQIRYAAIFVNSSDYEGISNAMLEAMAMGIPCICTDCPVGGAAMVIQNNVNGILIPVGDTEALSAAMESLIENKNMAVDISNRASEIRKEYSSIEIGKRWLSLLKP